MPVADIDILQQLQRDTHARLESAAAFYYVPVLLNRPRDAGAAVMIRETLNKALMGISKKNGKGGLACMVMMPDAEVPDANPAGPMFDILTTVRVFENPIFNEGANGTGISAEQCALNILNLCHHWNPGTGLVYAHKKALREGAAPEGSLAYDVVLMQRQGMRPRSIAMVPHITVADGSMTIISNTESADIWWTNDDTLPTPSNGLLYAAPVDVSGMTGQRIRAVAYHASLAASDGTLKQL